MAYKFNLAESTLNRMRLPVPIWKTLHLQVDFSVKLKILFERSKSLKKKKKKSEIERDKKRGNDLISSRFQIIWIFKYRKSVLDETSLEMEN